ncbi:MAG: hypothetical protein WBP81_00275 [Solirubrobacteraceae bacterium]
MRLAGIQESTAIGHPREVVAIDYNRMAGPEGLTMMRNTITGNDVIMAVARSAAQGMHAGEVLAHVDRFRERNDVIELVGRRYTTQDLLSAERARQRAQLGRIDERTGVATDRARRDGAGGLSLNDGQRGVVRRSSGPVGAWRTSSPRPEPGRPLRRTRSEQWPRRTAVG